MQVGEYCKRGVITVNTDESIAAAARTMREEHMGSLIVIESGDVKRRSVGVLTDRDIIVRVVARGVDPETVTVADAMSGQPIVASDTDDLAEAAQGMRIAGIRRMPVLNQDGVLTGVIALDDVLEIIAGLACDVCGTVRAEQRHERRVRVD